MKIFYLIATIFLLTFIGCSSTYKVSDFSSKDKFYEDFNNFARNKSVKVTLLNDSSFSINGGAAMQNDSLYSLGEVTNTRDKRLALSDTKEINYSSNNYKSATILLKNGEKYQAEQIQIISDSIDFAYTREVFIPNDITSVNKLKEISYKNHWLGIIPGFFAGIPLGIILGVSHVIPTYATEGNPPQSTYDETGAFVIGIPLGIIIGSVIGWVSGWDYTYQFNP